MTDRTPNPIIVRRAPPARGQRAGPAQGATAATAAAAAASPADEEPPAKLLCAAKPNDLERFLRHTLIGGGLTDAEQALVIRDFANGEPPIDVEGGKEGKTTK
jgi:hypothetical protein